MRRVMALVSVVLLAAPAGAGTLHDVVNGLAKATGGQPATSGSSGGGGTSAGDVLGAIVDGLLDPDMAWSGGSGPPYTQPVLYGSGPAGAATLSAYLGLQSVIGSDGAGTIAAHASFEDLGFGLEATRYWEGPTSGQPSVQLDYLRLFGSYRLVHDGALAIWLEGGGAAVLALEDETILGGFAGLRVEKHVAGQLGVSLEIGGAVYSHGILGLEAEAAVDLWLLRVGYRVLAFDVGPPLHGPELGIAVTF